MHVAHCLTMYMRLTVHAYVGCYLEVNTLLTLTQMYHMTCMVHSSIH